MKTSLYLPDDLAEQVRTFDLSVSEITQAALRNEISKIEAKQRATSDLGKAAIRLKATIDEDIVNQRKNGLEDGANWAKDVATAAELRSMEADLVLTGGRPLGRDDLPASCIEWVEELDAEHVAFNLDSGDSAPYWESFSEGALSIWKAVQPLL